MDYVLSPGYAKIPDEIKAKSIRRRYEDAMGLARTRIGQQRRTATRRTTPAQLESLRDTMNQQRLQ